MVELWDTAGHERYRTIVYNYFFLSQAAAVVFDLTDPSSLEEAKVWLQQVEAHCGERLPKVLLGNKLDLLDQGGQKTALEYFKP